MKQNNRKTIIAIAFLILFDVIVWSFIISPKGSDKGETTLYLFDVGQGDSEFITLPSISSKKPIKILVDGGPPNNKATESLSRVLSENDRYIDLVIMTHPQLDHFGGLIDILRKYEIGAFIGTGRKGEIKAYEELRNLLMKKKIPYITIRKGDKVSYEDHELVFLNPGVRDLISSEVNDSSLVFTLSSGDFSALYTGDIDERIEKNIADEYDLDTDILKISHHGSRFSSNSQFLEELTPQFSIIEVGKNTYGHPTKEAIDRIYKSGSEILRTDVSGIIKIAVSKGSMKVFEEKKKTEQIQ